MTDVANEEKIAAAIESAESIPEAISILVDNGFPLDKALLSDSLSLFETEGELSENELEFVSGGAIAFALKQLLEKLKKKGQKQGSSGNWHSGGPGRHA